MHPRRRAHGFTLVELMVTVTIVAVVAVIGARVSSKYGRGNAGGRFARGMIIAAHEAREAAVALKTTTRLRIDHTNKRLITEQVLDPTASPWTWKTLGGSLQVPSGVELCETQNVAATGTTVPTCPVATDTRICFDTSGRVNVPTTATSDTCAVTTLGTGATLFIRTDEGQTSSKQFKLVIYGLTGLPKLSDRW